MGRQYYKHLLLTILGMTCLVVVGLCLVAVGFLDWVNSLNEGPATFWGALIGLWGIALSVWITGYQTRQRDERIVKEQREALAAALLAEIAFLSTAARQFDKEGGCALEALQNLQTILSVGETPVFTAVQREIGILGDYTAKGLVNFYLQLRLIRDAPTDPLRTGKALEQFASVSRQVMTMLAQIKEGGQAVPFAPREWEEWMRSVMNGDPNFLPKKHLPERI